jgi:hypothetical protein
MPIIKIPSSNIYDKSPISFNKKSVASIESTKFISENGSILTEGLTATFYEMTSIEASTYKYVGENTDKNKFPFTLNEATGKATAEITLETKDLARLAISGDTITSHKLRTKKTWAIFVKDKYVGTQEIIKVYTPVIKSYKNHIITLEYTVGVVDGLGGTNFTVLLTDNISIVGEYFDTEKETVVTDVGGTNSNTIKLPTNELESTSNLYSNESFAEFKTTLVRSRYFNGKEVYTLKCSVANYYDKDGNISISLSDSAYPMAFEKYMIVEPYIHTSRGEVPLSTNIYGTPKQFEVIGVDFSYRGVVWQELTIQEYV